MKKYYLPQAVVSCFVSTLLLAGSLWVRAEIIGDSISEFSGVQGQNSWFYGYRAFASESTPINYDPIADFIPFSGGDGQGAWNGTTQLWTGSAWDLNTAAAAPWTFIAQTNLHPNGINNGTIHWAIRRWFGEELFGPTAVAITWHVRKEGSGGNGVTGAIHVNGVRVDSVAIPGTDTIGVYRTYYINADFGTLVDLVLDPRGPDGQSQDGSDSSFNWMVVDTTIPEIPRQPDGSLFIPADAPDTDADGLPDVWEKFYLGNDLTQLSAVGDYDHDGLLDPEELARGTDPTKTDTDSDGLTDAVETNTGVFWDVNDTGTNPLKPDTDGDGRTDGAEVLGSPTSNPILVDTDGDGFSDGDEVSTGHNPNDPANNPLTTLIANSVTEFSGVQGQNDWFFGYRNLTADGGAQNYNPDTAFIAFPPEAWTGSQWDLNTAAAAPWTELGAENTHPNTGAGAVHWTVRRWVATELTEATALAIRWHTRHVNTACGGNGITGLLYLNGQLQDSAVIAAPDGVGVFRTFYINAQPGDKVDLALSPKGTDGLDSDGCDGSANWFHVDPTIPASPRQPDGTPFIPINAGDSDADGIPDIWEQIYFPGDLTKLSKFGDFEGDGLTDLGEFERGTNPTVADTDGDGLLDRVETGTGVFVDANNTGSIATDADSDGDGLSDSAEVNGSPATDPNKADTDGDGFSDALELAEYSDPTDPADVPFIADSAGEFSGAQGQNGWYNGYRNYTLDGGGNNYDPDTDFIPYPGGAGAGAWDGITQAWTGSGWNLNSSGSGPWTSQSSLDIHPNGVNSTPNEEQWSTRRWVAAELADVTPAVIIWQVIKANLGGGSGVTGSLHVNGQQVDAKTIAYNDNTNPSRRYYVNLQPGDKVDLALTPEGIGGDRADGADGSQTWFRVGLNLPREPRQPDGSLFIPAGAQDSDGDGLLDFWELIYATDLATLTGTGDNDGDGLNNLGEFQRDANPLVTDTDGDGLVDGVETATGVFVSDSDTGTSPRKTDSDGDGYADGVEVNLGKDPNNPASNPTLANSTTEFSGVQGQNDWFFGYRDLTVDGGAATYDPDLNFIPFADSMWNGWAWDLDSSGAAPWTTVSAEDTHPNGSNSGNVHWAIRRWVANELTRPTPVAVHWHVRKMSGATCGNGVTGAIYANGVLVDSSVIAADDLVGTTRTCYVNLNPGDALDLADEPNGTHADYDGGFLNDWCDGSDLWMRLDTIIPPNPVQPDGTPFIPVNALPAVSITSPADGATFSAGTSATITAVADDPDGRVLQVEFFAAGVGSLGVDLAAPWEVTIPNIPVGTFILTAVATDNLGGSTTSDPVTVTVTANRPPVGLPDAYTTLEDTMLQVAAPGVLANDSDPDGNPIRVSGLPGWPSHGEMLIFDEGYFFYTPSPNFHGTDSFKYIITDGLVDSEQITVTITVLPVNDPPVCSGASATVCENQAVDTVLSASDVEGDALSYWIVDPPANGTVTVVGNVATYQGNLNYSGPDSFTFKVTDPAGAESAPCTVSVTVLPGNDTPVAVIKVTPTVDLGPTVSGINVLSPNNVGACVTLDGTQSSDGDNAFSDLSFTWLVNGVVVGTGPVLPDVCLLVGENAVTLVVNDGTTAASACDQPAEGTSTVMVTVLTGAEATEELINQIYDSVIERKNKQPFIASLKNAAAAFERGSFGAGLNMLNALIHKFEAQLKGNPDIQAQWIMEAQNIIKGLSEPVTCEGCSEMP